MTRTTALSVVCLAAGIGLGSMLSRPEGARAGRANDAVGSPAATTQRSAGDDGELRRVNERLARLEQGLAALRKQTPEPAAEPEEDVLSITAAEQHEDSRARLAEQLGALSAALQKQPRDVAWARPAESHIFEAMRTAELARDNQVTRVECKQSLCELEVAHGSQQAADELSMALPMTLSEFGSTWFTLKKDESGLRSIFYFARVGTRLPEPSDT
jgi:hypothetical protein